MRSRRLRSMVLAGCALAGFAANTPGQFVASWTSATSGTWTNAANWSTNPVFPNNNSPVVGDTYDAVINAVGPAYTVTLDSPITINSLHLNSPSATLQQNGTLTLVNGGTITAGTYRLQDSSVLSGSGSFNNNGGNLLIPASVTGPVVSTTINNRSLMQISSVTVSLNNGTINNLAGGILILGGANGGMLQGVGGNHRLVNAGTILESSSSISRVSTPLVNSGTITSERFLVIESAAHLHDAGSWFSGSGQINLSGGTHTILGATTVDASIVLEDGVTIAGPGTLTVNRAVSLRDGTITGSGPLVVTAAGQLNLLGTGNRFVTRDVNNFGRINLAGTGSSSVTFNGVDLVNAATGLFRVSSTAATIPFTGGTIANAGTLLFDQTSPSGTINLSSPLVNSGTILSNGAGLAVASATHATGAYLGGASTITLNGSHQATGTMTISGTVQQNGPLFGAGNIDLTGFLNVAASGNVAGTGTVRVAPGAAVTTMSSNWTKPIINSGTTILRGSTFNSSGPVTNNNLGVLQLTTTFTAPLQNFGTIITTNAVINSSGTQLFVNSGTILATTGQLSIGTGTHTFLAGSYLGGIGTITFAGAANVVQNGTVTLASGTTSLLGSISGNGPLVVTGLLNWQSGTLGESNGTASINIMSGAKLDVLPGGTRVLGRDLNNYGTANFAATVNPLAATHDITNHSTGVMDVYFAIGGNGLLTNHGTLNLRVPSVTTFKSFENSGTVNVFQRSVTLTDPIFRSGSWLGGFGDVRFENATTEGTVTFAHEFVLPTTIRGSGDLVVHGVVVGGTIEGTGNVHVRSGGRLQLSNLLERDLYVDAGASFTSFATSMKHLSNNGRATLRLGHLVDGQMINFEVGLLELSGGTISGSATSLLDNRGFLQANAGSNTINVSASNSGTVEVGGGTLNFNSGIAQLTGSTLTAGKWIVGFDAQLNINDATIATNQADISLNGPLSRFPSLNSLADNQGTFSLRLGRSFTAAGSLTNSGVINIDNGGALFVNDALFNSGTVDGMIIQTGSSTLSGNSYIKTLRGGEVFVETSAAARVDYLDAAALSIASSADLTLGAGSIAHVIDVLNIAPADGTLSAGRLDLLSGRLVIDYTGASPADAVAQLLATGFNNGDWLGRGITSSSILAGSNFAIGMIESAELFSMGGTFGGVNVDATALLLDRTLKGDANLDYTVNISDFAIVAANFNNNSTWSSGDFNYDGVTNISDFALLAANFNQSMPSDLPRGSIPEPSTLGMLAIFSCGVASAARR